MDRNGLLVNGKKVSVKKHSLSIEYLELYGVTVAVVNWLRLFGNMKIVLFCDNQAVVNMINNATSSCKNCMVLLRIIILEGLVRNTRVFARYVTSKDNGKADALSRMQINRFWSLVQQYGHSMNREMTPIPEALWPKSKLWLWEY